MMAGDSATWSENCESHLLPTIIAKAPPAMSDGKATFKMSAQNILTIFEAVVPVTFLIAISFALRCTSSAV